VATVVLNVRHPDRMKRRADLKVIRRRLRRKAPATRTFGLEAIV